MTNEIPELDKSGLRQFGLTTGAIVAGLFGIVFPYLLDVSWPLWPWLIFAILASWALIAPSSFIMTLLFLITILPGALLLRLFRKDPMRRSFDDSASYRVNAKQPSVQNLEKPY